MRNTGSIRLRSDGVYEIRYSLGYDKLTGKRKRIHKTITGTYKDAEKELRRVLRAVDTGEHVDPVKINLGEFLTVWLQTMRSRISPKTHERYGDIVNHFLIPALGHCRLNKLEPLAIQGAYNSWEVGGRRDKKKCGLAPRTRLHIHRVLRQALKHAINMRLIPFNPADLVTPPRAKRPSINTLTIEQSSHLLDALDGTPMYWPVLLALTTGMRRGEIVALRWKNINFHKKLVQVVESIEQVKRNIRFKAPKTDKTRAVLLPDYAVEELKLWKEAQFKELARLGVGATDDTFVCGRSWDGGVLKPDSLTAEFRVAIRRIPNFPIIRFHDLRHTHATQLMSEGIHPKIAQERLGHSTITTTLDLYSHATDTMQNDAIMKLDTAFRAVERKSKSMKAPELK